MRIRVVPQGQAMERISPSLRAESNPRRESPMATKEKQSSGESEKQSSVGSRGHQKSDESKQERAKPAEARSRGRGSDEAHLETSRNTGAQADEKHERASDREHHENDTRARGEQSAGDETREQARKDAPAGNE